jgi:hypothetical protein
MVAPEQQNVGARRLRRAVAELDGYSIDDVESIWRVLSDTERAQLRPLLADMPYLAGSGADTLDAANAPRMPSVASDEDCTLRAERLLQIAYLLPPQLMSRLLDCVDHRTRSAVIDALPPDSRALLTTADRPCTITERARNALREAALTVLGSVDDLSRALPTKPPTFAQKIRRLLERRA